MRYFLIDCSNEEDLRASYVGSFLIGFNVAVEIFRPETFKYHLLDNKKIAFKTHGNVVINSLIANINEVGIEVKEIDKERYMELVGFGIITNVINKINKTKID